MNALTFDFLDARTAVSFDLPEHGPSVPRALAAIAYEPHFRWLEIIIARSRPRDGAYKLGKKRARFIPHRAPTVAEIKGHFSGGPKKVGGYLMAIGSSETMLWVIDIDDHDGTLGWDELCRRADAVTAPLVEKGLCPARCRSSGGKGIHLWGYWDEPQDAYSARQMLKGCVLAAGLEVKAGVAEVFPAQDRIEQGACGNPVFWPVERLDAGDWLPSAPVPVVEPPERASSGGAFTGDLALLREATMAIPNGGESGDEEQPYGEGEFGYLKVGMGLHDATGGGDEGLEIWHDWSAQSSKYDHRDVDRRWRSFKAGGGITARSIFAEARKHGWAAPADIDRMFGDAAAAQGEGEGADSAQAGPDAGESLEAAVERLAKLPPLQYDRLRSAEAKRLGVRSATLDAAVTAARKRMGLDDADERGKQGKPIEFEEAEPWPSPVDGAQLLDDLVSTIRRFAVLPQHGAEAVALWTMHTYLLDEAEHTPRLVLSSPVPRCGKTTTFDMMAELAHRPLPAASVSSAALFRLIEAYTPCIMLDELDALLEKDQTGDIRGLINAGHSRATAYVVRTVGEDFEPRSFSVWAPMAMALIGSLEKRWATVADRAVVIPMQRKSPGTRLPRLRSGKKEFAQLRRQITRWAEDHRQGLQGAEPDMPEALNDRAADNWRPLFAIAEAAGGAWPQKARKTAIGLSGSGTGVSAEADGAGVRLLSDIRGIFNRRGGDRIKTDELLHELAQIDDPDAPWSDWNQRRAFGGPIEAKQLAGLLKPFVIFPGTIKLLDGSKPDTAKGYYRKQFEEAFRCYLGPENPPPVGD